MLRTILKPLSFVPALIMMYIIFSFSAQDGDMSGQLSYQASVKIIETADYVFNANLSYDQIDEWANKIDFITRKLAHMTEYFALAIAVSFPLYVYGLHGILLMFLAGLICVGFACGDEFHQSFIAGRSPSARDVCIDSVVQVRQGAGTFVAEASDANGGSINMSIADRTELDYFIDY